MSISYSYQRTDLFPRQLLKDNILHNNEKTSRRQEFTYENPSFGQLVLISCDWFSSNSRVKRWAQRTWNPHPISCLAGTYIGWALVTVHSHNLLQDLAPQELVCHYLAIAFQNHFSMISPLPGIHPSLVSSAFNVTVNGFFFLGSFCSLGISSLGEL